MIDPREQPILASLPGEQGAYTDNIVAQWLCAPWDESTATLISSLENFYDTFLNPATAREDALDWLAQLAGYTGTHWDVSWPAAAKRQLIAEAYTRVWPERGSEALLQWLFGVFDIDVEIVTGTEPFRAGVSRAGDLLGGPLAEFHVVLPDGYSRAAEWLTVRKLISLATPLWIPYTISYDTSRAGTLRAGEVVR